MLRKLASPYLGRLVTQELGVSEARWASLGLAVMGDGGSVRWASTSPYLGRELDLLMEQATAPYPVSVM